MGKFRYTNVNFENCTRVLIISEVQYEDILKIVQPLYFPRKVSIGVYAICTVAQNGDGEGRNV